MKLNLGCGLIHRDGYINVDQARPCDSVVNLNVFPWPWDDNSATEVYANQWLEHVENFHETIREIHRVLKPEGIVRMVVPHHRSAHGPWPEVHLHQFSFFVFDRLSISIPYVFDGEVLFKRVSVKHRASAAIPRPLRKPFELAANMLPRVWESLGMPTSFIEWTGSKHDPK